MTLTIWVQDSKTNISFIMASWHMIILLYINIFPKIREVFCQWPLTGRLMSLTIFSSPSGALKLEMFPLVRITRGPDYSSLLILLWAHFIFIHVYVWVCGPCVKLYCGGQRVFDLKLEMQMVGIHWNWLATGNQTFPSHLLSSRAHREEEEVEITHRIWDLEIYSKVSYEERQVYCLQHACRAAKTFNFQSISMVLIYLFVYLLTYP